MDRKRIIALALAVLMLLGIAPQAFGAGCQHEWSEWTVEYGPTCGPDGAGLKKRTCLKCGEVEEEDIPALDHSWGAWVVEEPATCVSTGLRSRTCTRCGEWEEEDIPVDANAHRWSAWRVRREATCSAEGSRTHVCELCGRSETEAVAKLAHTWGPQTTLVEATCTQEGKVSRTCTVCGEEDVRVSSRLPHDWGDWTVIEQATCSQTGRRKHTCKTCGFWETDVIPTTAHDWGEWTTVAEPTCTRPGERRHVCRTCGAQASEVVPMTEHAWGAWTTVRAATCTAAGEESAVCVVCGKTQTRTVAPLNHAFGEWTVLSELTDLSNGEKERVCAGCGLREHVTEEPAGVLRYGDQGGAVRRLQNALDGAGYECGIADGDFGYRTQNAIMAFEGDNGLEQDGVGWPGVLRILLHGSEMPEKMILQVTAAPDPSCPIPEGASASFTLALGNNSGLDITAWTLYQTTGGDAADDWTGAQSGGFLAVDSEAEIPVSYTISEADANSGTATVHWYVSAQTADGTVYSNEVSWEIQAGLERPRTKLWVLETPVVPFTLGAQVTVPVCFHNVGGMPVRVESVSCSDPQDVCSDHLLTAGLFEPGSSQDFTVTLTLTAADVAGEWSYHTVTVSSVDPETGMYSTVHAHIFLARKTEGASVLLIPEDATGLSGDMGDWLYLPLAVVNNGSADLKIDSFRDDFPQDHVDFDDTYRTLLAPGASFQAELAMFVVSADIAGGMGERLVELRAKDIASGAEIQRTEKVCFACEGGAPKVVLTMIQVTPNQAHWAPDDAGDIAEIEYLCTVKNAGQRHLLLKSLAVKMWPDTEHYTVLEDFGGPELLPRGETFTFTATLPIAVANIWDGTASETSDGSVLAYFHVSAALDGDPEMLTVTESDDVSFVYPVSTGGFDWAPPSPEPAASPAELALDETHCHAGKSVMNASVLAAKYSWLTNPFCLNEKINFEVEITNTSSDTLYDVEVVDSLNGVEYVIGSFESIKASDFRLIVYPHTVTAQDVADGEIRNRVWATYRIGDSDERVRCPEAEVVCHPIGLESPAGTPSTDLSVVKTARWNGKSVSFLENPHVPVNADVEYSITVRNDAKAPIDHIEVFDALTGLTAPIGVIATLAPGQEETVKFHYIVQPDDVDRTYVFNTAVAEWTDAGGAKRFAYDQHWIDTSLPPVTAVKTVTSEPGCSKGYEKGNIVHYEISVTNNTDDAINVDVRDPLYGSESNPTGRIAANMPIAAGETMSVGFDYTVTADDVYATKIINCAAVDWILHETFYTNTVETPTVERGLILVSISPTNASEDVNGWAKDETAQGVVTVRNLCSYALKDIDVYQMNDGDYASRIHLAHIDWLEGDSSQDVPWQRTVTQFEVDAGTFQVTGSAYWQEPVEDVPMTQTTLPIEMDAIGEKSATDGTISVFKVVDGSAIDPAAGYQENEVIHFRIWVTNVSAAPVTADIYDYMEGMAGDGMFLKTVTLTPGVPVMVPYDRTVVSEDASKGTLVNYGVVLYADDTGPKRLESLPVSVDIAKPRPQDFTVVKTRSNDPIVPAGYQPGEKITYEIAVTNNTAATVDYVPVYDFPNGSTTPVPLGTFHALAPNETRTETFAYTVQPEDIPAGAVINQAAVILYGDQGEDDLYYLSNVVSADVIPRQYILEAYKSVDKEPDNHSYFVEGEYIHFKVYVRNTTGAEVTDVRVIDPLSDAPGHVIGEIASIPDGGDASFYFQYQVTGLDAGKKNVINYADVEYTDVEGKPCVVITDKVKAPTQKPVEACSVLKKVVNKPANGEYFVAGETICYLIYVSNTGDVFIDDIYAYDTLKTADYGLIGEEHMPVNPEGTCVYTFKYVVTPDDAEHGKVVNIAYALWRVGAGLWQSSYSEPVVSRAGAPKAAEPKECCRRVLTGKGDGAREYALEYCDEHAAVAEQVRALIAEAGAGEGQLAAWEQSIALWTQALNAEYDEWFAAASEAEKPIILDERVQFFIQLAAHREALAGRYPDDPARVAMLISEQLMNKAADLCYETHTAPEDRVDSVCGEGYAPIEAPEAAESCLRIVAEGEGAVRYQENLCGRHRAVEAGVDALLRGASSVEARANAWQRARNCWLVELDALTNARYRAADPQDRPGIAAERVSLGYWLNAREAFLQCLYPDRPDIVNEVMTDAIRARVLDLCGE